jgi:ATP-dependent Lon protease
MIVKLHNTYYTSLKNEYDIINFHKDYLINMMNNLLYMNNLSLYIDTDSLFNILLEELKIIKNELDNYYNIIHIKKYNESSISKIEKIITKLLIKYSNHISSNNLNDIFKLFFNYNIKSKINKDILDFLLKFVKPISVWDSEYHKDNIPYISLPENNKKKIFTKDLINSILGITKMDDNINIRSLIINSVENKSNDLSGKEIIVVKSLSDLIESTENKFDYVDCINILGNTNFQITKNNNSGSLIEDKQGVNIYIKDNTRVFVIQGLINDDLLKIAQSLNYVHNKIKQNKAILAYETVSIPKYFRDNYIRTQNLRDTIIINKIELIEDIKKKYNDYKLLQTKPLVDLINEFLLSSKYRKIDILTLLLMSNEDDQKIAHILFDIFKNKDKKNVSNEIYNSLHYSIRELLDISKELNDKEEIKFSKISENDIPYEKRISMMKVSDDIKIKAYEKLKMFKNNHQNDGKAQNWLDGLLKIPFGTYNDNDIISFKSTFIKKHNINNVYSDNDIDNHVKENNELSNEWYLYKKEKKDYITSIRKELDSAVYGHKDAKLQLERLFAQWINGESKGAIIGLQGPPGTGKTSLAKHGLSKCLKNKNGIARPFAFLPIGGSVNSSTLVGHNFTYVGSTWGRIADILMTTKCMNPIIFIDEIDKVSHTEYGREIISVLTHMTDPTQNNEFEDKYFAGIPLDLSKALIIFSFNDVSLLDPILRDRITIIDTHPLNINDKLTIINDYMLPEICKDVGFNKNEIIINNNVIKHIIETYTHEAGVRKIKEKIVELVRDINLNRFNSDNFPVPYEITLDYVNRLFENKPKIRVKKIVNEPMIGLVNGLYATTSGIGGLTVIQLSKFPSDKMLDIQLTGKPGDMMKESVQYALKVAWSLLTKKLQNKLIKDNHNKKSFGIHIHCPDAATPKDGPSAGAAFTLAIYSLLTDKKINNKVCITGEIDLLGNITAIGGIESKLFGGKKAGCTLGLIPQENWEDFEILIREGNSPEDNTFSVKPISHIKELIKYAIMV